MRLVTLIASLLLLATFVPPASAGHCNGTVTTVGVVHIDDRGADAVWIYVESNGVPGLQSGGNNGLWDDWCYHDNPDTLIY